MSLFKTAYEIADVLSFIHWYENKQGRGITAYGLARGHDCSVGRARRILNALVGDGLVQARLVTHRPNINKMVYVVELKGANLYRLMGFSLPFENNVVEMIRDAVAHENA